MNIKKLVVVTLSTVVLCLVVFLEPLRFVDNLFYDLNFAFSASGASDSVVVVGIDPVSIDKVGGWPWSRTRIATLIQGIEEAGARAIALDILFPRREDAPGDDSLAVVLSRVDRLVLPFRVPKISRKENLSSIVVPAEIFPFRFLRLSNMEMLYYHLFYSATHVSSSAPRFMQSADYSGFLNVPTSSSSQKLREMLHVIKAGSEYYPSFGVAAVAAYYGLTRADMVLDGKPAVMLGDKTVTISGYAGTAYINYRDPDRQIRVVSASSVLQGTLSPGALKDKLVFVGITDSGTGVKDFFITPTSVQFPGVLAWATSALDIIENRMIRWGGGLWGMLNWILVFCIFPGCALLIPGRFRLLLLGSGLILTGCSVVVSILLFRQAYFFNPVHHLYAWFFSVLWLAVQKVDPSLGEEGELELEPLRDDADTPAPPATEDFCKTVPSCSTARHCAALLSEAAGDTGETTATAAQTVSGTVIEQSLQDDRPATEISVSSDAPVVALSDTQMEHFRSCCGGSIIRLLGRGGMADVYLSWNPRLEVYRAIKVLQPGQHSSYVSRFETELKIVSKLNHPNIVHCYGVGEWFSLPCVEMEYVNGVSFEEVLAKTTALTPVQVCTVGALVCRALDYAHSRTITMYGETYHGVVHRDIKPANIMLSKSARIKLTDFGIARPQEVSLHTMDAGSVVGTLPYLAPEQLDGAGVTPQTDLYALGATLYELLTGKRAFPQTEVTALVKAKSMGQFAPLRQSQKITRQVIDVISRAMATRPLDRFDTAANMGTALQACVRALCKNAPSEHILELAHDYWH